jgi:transposase
MRHLGLEIDSQTLWDQMDALAAILAPTYEAICKAVRQAPHRLLDNRSRTAAAEVLGGYDGIVMADGYGVYEALASSRQISLDGKVPGGFRLVHCWAHVRRKFVEAEAAFPEQAKVILDLIAELYRLDGEAAGDMLQLGVIRKTRSHDVLRQLDEAMSAPGILPRSSLGQAVAYARKLWPGLVAFLEDPRIPLDNNLIERELRPIVLGRKNHQGSRSQRGTEVAALFYTLLESARLCGKDPRDYLLAATMRALESPGTVTLPEDWQPHPD